MPDLTVARRREIYNILKKNIQSTEITFTFPLSEEMKKAVEEEWEILDVINKVGLYE